MPLFEVEVFISPTTILVEAENHIEAREQAELQILNKGFEVDDADTTEIFDGDVDGEVLDAE